MAVSGQMVALEEARRLVAHTLLVREEAEIVLSLLKDAETGQRGFLITGDPKYLEPYDGALDLLPVHIRQLRSLTEDNPVQKANLDRLDTLITAKLQELETTIGIRRRQGLPAVLPIVSSNVGKRTMDTIRALMATVRQEEDRLYDERTSRLAREARLARVLEVVGFVFALGLVTVATALLVRASRQREEEQATRRVSEALAAASVESEERLRVTVESIGDAVIATDEVGYVTLMNPVAQAMTGWTEASARGRALEEIFIIVDETSRRPVENPTTKVLREGKIVAMANHTVLIARDGREIQIDDSAAPIRAADGRLQGVVLVFRGVTEQRMRERERAALLDHEQAARREAEAASRAKDEFLAILSHELRTLLNAIFGWVRMLRRGDLEPVAATRAIEVIERNTREHVQLIEALLDMSRVITGKLMLEMRAMDLRAVAEAAVDTVSAAAAANGVRLETHYASAPASVFGDPERLQQVVWNLLTNAVKFTPPNGRIDVWLEGTESEVELRIVDTGRGIAAELLPNVFDRFRQGDASLTRTEPGLGIGLALVRHLVEMHGGTVRADSEGDGRGATFTVRLPRRTTGSPPAPFARGPGDLG